MQMKIKNFIWKYLLDPIIIKIGNRLEHYRGLQPVTHRGLIWAEQGQFAKSVVFYSDASVVNYGSCQNLAINEYCHIRGEIVVFQSGRLNIGSHTYIGIGSRVWCRQGISIGSHVLISHYVDIHDSNSHSMNWKQRRIEQVELFENRRIWSSPDIESAKVIIEDDAWIGLKTTILKGVRIGRGAVIGANSVVTKDAPPFTLVAGNPARVVRQLPN